MVSRHPGQTVVSTAASFPAAIRAIVIAALLASSAPGFADDDIAAVRATVFDYFDGINEKDRERIDRAFDDSAYLKSVADDGTLRAEPIAEAKARWMEAAARSRTGSILSVDVFDGRVARVVFDFDGVYVDFLTLFKIDGEWKIVDKAFLRK